MLMSFFEELQAVFISQVHQDPLNPHAVIFAFELKLLESFLEEISDFWYVFLRLSNLFLCWFKQINIFEPRYQSGFSYPAHSPAAVDCIYKPRYSILELINHSPRSFAVDFVDLLKPSQNTINGCGLFFPVFNSALVPMIIRDLEFPRVLLDLFHFTAGNHILIFK